MLNIVLDENIPLSLQTILRDIWYKVCHIGEISWGISDKKVLDFCSKENSILITQDKDFWHLLYFKRHSSMPYSLIFVRYSNYNNRLATREKIVKTLSIIEKWWYYTITTEQIKRRPLP